MLRRWVQVSDSPCSFHRKLDATRKEVFLHYEFAGWVLWPLMCQNCTETMKIQMIEDMKRLPKATFWGLGSGWGADSAWIPGWFWILRPEPWRPSWINQAVQEAAYVLEAKSNQRYCVRKCLEIISTPVVCLQVYGPDLVIQPRASCALVLLPWQTAYSELYLQIFLTGLTEGFERCVVVEYNRNRRFGVYKAREKKMSFDLQRRLLLEELL